MKRFEIFRPGKHIASSGAAISFSEDDLKNAVAAYDPKIHEAPITVGHPKDNLPAYGWIGKLEFSEGGIHADPAQVDPTFEEMVQAGRFKKRSASWYTPTAPTNPVPGKYYLKHVAFLGAAAPAVKGLKEVAFSSNEEGVIEFEEDDSDEGLFRKFLNWFQGTPEFREAHKPANNEDSAMTPEQIAEMNDLKAKVTTLTTENTDLKGKVANFTEREADVNKRDAELKKATVATMVGTLVAAGKVLPAEKDEAIEYAMTLDDGAATIDFKEATGPVKVSQREYYLRKLAVGPKKVEFKEVSKGEEVKITLTSDEDIRLASEKAQEYVAEQAKKGKVVSFTEAMHAVVRGEVETTT